MCAMHHTLMGELLVADETVQLRAHAMLPMCLRLLDAAVEGFCTMLGTAGSPLMQAGCVTAAVWMLAASCHPLDHFASLSLAS